MKLFIHERLSSVSHKTCEALLISVCVVEMRVSDMPRMPENICLALQNPHGEVTKGGGILQRQRVNKANHKTLASQWNFCREIRIRDYVQGRDHRVIMLYVNTARCLNTLLCIASCHTNPPRISSSEILSSLSQTISEV